MAAYAERTLSEHLALLKRGLSTISVEDVEENLVFSLARNDDHVVEVLSTSTDE